MSEELTLNDLIERIKASLDELQRFVPTNDWESKRLQNRLRNHIVAFGVAELTQNLAAGLGPDRARAFATHDEIGVHKMDYFEVVLEPANVNAAPIRAHIDWHDDTVILYPGAGGRVELWPRRNELGDDFVATVAKYYQAVVAGGFRATYWIKTRGTPFTVTLPRGEVISAKLEFLIDNKWRRAGEILPGAPGADKLKKTYEPY